MKKLVFLLSITVSLFTACGGSDSDTDANTASPFHPAPQNGAQPSGREPPALDEFIGTWRYPGTDTRERDLGPEIYHFYQGNNDQIFLEFEYHEPMPMDNSLRESHALKSKVILSVRIDPNENLIEINEINSAESGGCPLDVSIPEVQQRIRENFKQFAKLKCQDGKLFRLIEARGETQEIELSRNLEK